MMDRREPADLDCARCGQPIQRDQRWEWEKDRGTARECFGRGQRSSRGSQGLPRDDITSGRGVRPRPRATSDKRYRGYIGERDNVTPIAGGQPLAGVVKSESRVGLDSTVTITDKI